MVTRSDTFLFINGRWSFFLCEGAWVPSLFLLQEQPTLLPQVVVDMGAVRFVTNGADIMRPGIVSCDEFPSGAVVAVVDERHKKPLALAQSLYSSSELLGLSSGKVLSSLYYVGDEQWNKYNAS